MRAGQVERDPRSTARRVRAAIAGVSASAAKGLAITPQGARRRRVLQVVETEARNRIARLARCTAVVVAAGSAMSLLQQCQRAAGRRAGNLIVQTRVCSGAAGGAIVTAAAIATINVGGDRGRCAGCRHDLADRCGPARSARPAGAGAAPAWPPRAIA